MRRQLISSISASALGRERPSLSLRLWVSLAFPMTRAHARLLGPCFKTGPESTQSYSVADGLGGSVRGDRRQQCRCSGVGTQVRGSRIGAAATCGGPDANRSSRDPSPLVYRRASEPGSAGGSGGRPRGRRPVCPAGSLRLAPNGSRRPTGGEVHAFATRVRPRAARTASKRRPST